MITQSPGLEARELELWRGERRLFTGLSLCVRPGEILHVRGPNGAGKTSLLKVLCGASPPEHGQVCWNGIAIAEQRLEYHAALAYLGHRDGLKQDLTARENLRYAMATRSSKPDRGIADMLAALGLGAVADLPVRALSAGQRRRVAIARCVLADAPLWILDEPFSNLDTDGRSWGHRCLARHLAGAGTIVITSHHPVELHGHGVRALELQ